MTVAIVANIARPISSAISTAFSADSYGLLSSYGLLGASANPDAVIEALFANDEEGAWYDPSDLSTMFQDSAGMTPVTAVGQPVGKILDKSGNGNHAIQATEASRPVLQQDGNGKYYLWYDGADDSLASPAFTAISASPLWTAFIGVQRVLDATMLICTNSLNEANKYFGVFQNGDGTSANPIGESKYRVDGADVAGSPSTTRGQLASAVLYAENRVITAENLTLTGWTAFLPVVYGAGYQTQTRLYSFILRGAVSTTQEIDDTEAWIAGKSGVFF